MKSSKEKVFAMTVRPKFDKPNGNFGVDGRNHSTNLFNEKKIGPFTKECCFIAQTFATFDSKVSRFRSFREIIKVSKRQR